MRHLENRLLEKCHISYQFLNLELFHPEWRNFDQNITRFLSTREKKIGGVFEIRDSRPPLLDISDGSAEMNNDL